MKNTFENIKVGDICYIVMVGGLNSIEPVVITKVEEVKNYNQKYIEYDEIGFGYVYKNKTRSYDDEQDSILFTTKAEAAQYVRETMKRAKLESDIWID